MIANLRSWWTGLARRERMLSAGAAVLAALALLFLVALEPAWKLRARLGAELPKLRAQAAEMKALAEDAKALAGRAAAAESAQGAQRAVEQGLVRSNLSAARVSVSDDRHLAVVAKGVPVTPWLAWAEETSRDLRLRIVSMQVTRTATRGVVDAELSFEIAGRR